MVLKALISGFMIMMLEVMPLFLKATPSSATATAR